MKAARTSLWLCLTMLAAPFVTAAAQSLTEARRYYTHGLAGDAKRVLIAILEGDDRGSHEGALYLLGTIAFNEGNVDAAASDWDELLERFPSSPLADSVTTHLLQTGKVTVAEGRALLYLRNGDFWLSPEHESTEFFRRDLPTKAMALEWYDRLIREFKGQEGAALGYQRKIELLFNDPDPSLGFPSRMAQIESLYDEFARMFPGHARLQAIRFAIGQRYYVQSPVFADSTAKWLQKVLDQSGGEQSVYTQAASALLAKLGR